MNSKNNLNIELTMENKFEGKSKEELFQMLIIKYLKKMIEKQ